MQVRWKTAAMKGRLLLLETELREEDLEQDEEEEEEEDDSSMYSPDNKKRRSTVLITLKDHPDCWQGLAGRVKINVLAPEGPFRWVSSFQTCAEKEEPLARDGSFQNGRDDSSFFCPMNASSAPWSSPPSLTALHRLAFHLITSRRGFQRRLLLGAFNSGCALSL